ncbi:MAG: hypothetical protein V2I39_00270 [Erythrobacter sp.]|jgi:hypothetical protein|nr:hypothetical protein [Erythrobacter sp.]
MATKQTKCSVLLWGEPDHKKRAEALAVRAPDVALHGQIDMVPKAVPGLETLVLWGHGVPAKFCGKTPREIHEVIKGWKKLNPGLKVAELLSCNLQHGVDKKPFVADLKRGIGRFSSLHGMKIKSLPGNRDGRIAWSILQVEPTSQTWIYLTAPGHDDSNLMKLKTLIDFETNAAGKSVSYKGSLITKAMELRKLRSEKKLPAGLENCNWTMNYGHMDALRAHLVEV